MNGIAIISYECKYICISVYPHVYVWGQIFAYINKLLVYKCTFLCDSVGVCLHLPSEQGPYIKVLLRLQNLSLKMP